MKPSDSSSYRNRGISENISSFEKNSVERKMIAPRRSGSQKSSSGEGQILSRNSAGLVDKGRKAEDYRHVKGTIASRKNDQWNMKRDIPAGTVRNNPFLPEPKKPPPQLKHLKKQWDTSNIPKGSVAARIQESNSPRKKSGSHFPISPTKIKEGSNGRPAVSPNNVRSFSSSRNKELATSGSSSPRRFSPKGPSSPVKHQHNFFTVSSEQITTQQPSSHQFSESLQRPNAEVKESGVINGWEPSREIPVGAVNSRISSLFGQVNSSGTKPNDTSPFGSTKTKKSDFKNTSTQRITKQDDDSTPDEADELIEDESQWIIPERNAATTQVFTSDWGEVLTQGKSAESEDWETPARDWIRSGESHTGFSHPDEASPEKPPTDQKPSLLGTVEPVLDEPFVREITRENIKKLSGPPSSRMTIPSILSPPPKDENAYHKPKGRSPMNSSLRDDKEVVIASHSALPEVFNDHFENFPIDLTSGEKSGIGNSFPENNNNHDLLNESSDAFGFPMSSTDEFVQSKNTQIKNTGEIIGGDEFFDASLVPNDYNRPNTDGPSFEQHEPSSVTSSASVEDDIQNRAYPMKAESKKKRKGFFKGLFGRKSKDKDSRKLKHIAQEDSKKLLIRKQHYVPRDPAVVPAHGEARHDGGAAGRVPCPPVDPPVGLGKILLKCI